MLFHTFDAHSFGKQLSDEQLYFELIKCLSPSQIQKVSFQLNNIRSFTALKHALLEAYTVPLHTRLSQLHNIHPQLVIELPPNFCMTSEAYWDLAHADLQIQQSHGF